MSLPPILLVIRVFESSHTQGKETDVINFFFSTCFSFYFTFLLVSIPYSIRFVNNHDVDKTFPLDKHATKIIITLLTRDLCACFSHVW